MTFLYLNSDQMGSGDPILGKKLLLSFLSEMAKSDLTINAVGLANSGINLTIEGSEALDSLKALQGKGARIASCGTCLDHFKVREKLQIGEIGTMDMMVAVIGGADKVIQP